MKLLRYLLLGALCGFMLEAYSQAPEKDGKGEEIFKVFQFAHNVIPRIDGDKSDWDMVPDSYLVTIDDMIEDGGKYDKPNKKSINVKVKVGWVKGLNRLYFLYEADDNYWAFKRDDINNDIFEIVVDGDRSGTPFIAEQHPEIANHKNIWDLYYNYQNFSAQNYHIFTPSGDKDWTMVWGTQNWLKDFPQANYAYNYSFKEGEKGKLIFEFYITAYDFAAVEGPQRSVESVFYENKLIGLCWAVLDYDNSDGKAKDGFWNLSKQHKMFGNADLLRTFRLMPVQEGLKPKVKADWTFTMSDDTRTVYFKDKSDGKITSWSWDFGDGETSIEQNPVHTYTKPGYKVVILRVDGSDGQAKNTKVWDVIVK